MKSYLSIFAVLIIFLLSACSSSQETTSSNNEAAAKEEIYVFDDAEVDTSAETTVAKDVQEMPKDTVANFIRDDEPEVEENITNQEETVSQPTSYFIVQVGAFSTKDKADTFVKENQKVITYPMEVQYSAKVNLFVVWLPKFNSREEAESVRNSLWKKAKFKDAFIITME